MRLHKTSKKVIIYYFTKKFKFLFKKRYTLLNEILKNNTK